MPISDFTLPSSFGLTFLLFIGLVFFIRASTKDRTQTITYCSTLDDVSLMEALQQYFEARAYRVTDIDAERGQISLEGTVGASVFLAVFLGGLAAIGFFCLALVLTISFPRWGPIPYLLVLLAPIASWFYWQGATRTERVMFRLFPSPDQEELDEAIATCLSVSAHRDELAVLESELPLKRREAKAVASPL